jgi:hypothetical protein
MTRKELGPRDEMISKRGSGSDQCIEQTGRTKLEHLPVRRLISGCNRRSPRVYVRSLVAVYTECVCLYTPRLFFPRLGEGAVPLRESRLRYRVTDNVTSPVVARNQQRGGQSGRLPPECSETTPAWICRYDPGQAPANPQVCPRPHPDSLRPVAVSGAPSPVDLVLSRELLSIHLPPRLCVSPLLLCRLHNRPSNNHRSIGPGHNRPRSNNHRSIGHPPPCPPFGIWRLHPLVHLHLCLAPEPLTHEVSVKSLGIDPPVDPEPFNQCLNPE